MGKINFLLISILTFVTIYRLFFGLGDQPIERWDEKTNIDVVTDSIAQNKFPILYLGQKPFFEKPPLWYLVNSVIGGVVDISPVSMRMTSAFAGLLIFILSAYITWRWWGMNAMMVTWVVLLSTDQLFVTNIGGYFATHTLRSADLDALQILFLIMAFIAAVEYKIGLFYPLVLGVSSGLAVLTKGPLGLLPLVILTGLELIKKGVRIKKLIIAWLTLLLFILPWYAFMAVKFGEVFLQENIGYHIAERVLVPLEGHNASIWYYFEILSSKKMFYFGFLLIPAFVWIVTRKKYRDLRIFFLILMVTLCFIIPTTIQTKLAWYILPIYPFAAMLIGAFVGDIAKLLFQSMKKTIKTPFIF